MRVLIFVPESLRADAEAAGKLYPRIETVINPSDRIQEARAVFYLGDKEWRQSMKDTYAHYHKSRRAFIFKKSSQLKKAIWLASKKESLIRWGALLPMAALFAAIVLLAVAFRDPLLHRGAVNALQGGFGARAEVADLKTTLTLSFQLQRVAVADRRKPMQNLFEFDRMAGGVSLDQLLAGRVHIDELALEGLKFGSPRKESGALPEAPAAEPVPEVQTQGVIRPLDDILKSLIQKLEPPQPDDLETVRRAKQVEHEARQRLEKVRELQKRLEAFRGVQIDIEAIRLARQNLDGATAINFEEEKKSIEQMRAEVEKARQAIKNAQNLTARAKEIKKVKVTDFLKVQSLIDDMQKAIKGLDDAVKTLDETAKKLEQTQQTIERKQKEAEAKLATAQQKIDEAKTIVQGEGLKEKLAQASGELTKQKAELEALKKDIETARKDVENGTAYFRAQPEALKQALESDKKMIEDRYSLERFTADEIIGTILGDETAKWLKWGLWLHRMLQPMLNRNKPAKVKGPSGTTYLFGAPADVPPKVWVRKVAFSGSHGSYRLEGRAQNISSDLARVGQDMTVSLQFEDGAHAIAVEVRATPSGDLTVEVETKGIPVEGTTIDNQYAPLNIGPSTLALKMRAEFRGDGVRASTRVSLEGLTVATGDRLNPRLTFLKDVCSGIRSVSADVSLVWSGGKISEFRCTSAEGSELTAVFRKALDAQVAALKKEATSKIEALAAEPMKRANEACEAFVQKAPGVMPANLASRVDTVLGASVDPDKAAVALRDEVDALAARRAQTSQSVTTSAGEQSAAAQAVSQMLSGEKEKVAGAKTDLKSEIERLIKEMK